MKKSVISGLFFFLFLPYLSNAQDANSFAKPNSNNLSGFIENKGQIIDQNNKLNPTVLYLLNTPGMNVQLREGGFSYDLYQISPPAGRAGNIDQRMSNFEFDKVLPENKSDKTPLTTHDSLLTTFHRIDINLEGANPECQVIPSDPLPDYFNYFTASAPSEGIKNVKQYSKITCKNIYPGIDLEFLTNEEHGYKYNFVIHPGADINDIQLRIEGPEYISLIRDTLKFGTRFGELEELIPESYYIVHDSKVNFHARFERLKNDFFGFSSMEPIPENELLVIDPTAIRLWGTYYGGTNEDREAKCTADKYGNVFLAGSTTSSNNIASTGSYQGTLAGSYDSFLAKFSSAGQRLWGTYIGGPNFDMLRSCFVDKSGNIYVSGDTQSTSGIASAGSHQTVYGGGLYDCYIEKFNQAGDRLWGTYYGGDSIDFCGFVTVDNNRNVFLTGYTFSETGIATAGSYQPNLYSYKQDAFLAKFDSNGVRQWGTYYGGEQSDGGLSCITDASGNVYFGGGTTSLTNIASVGAFQPTYGGGYEDALLVKFTTTGQRLWATYYGGSNVDEAYSCASDSAGNVYLVGRTNSPNEIASPGCHQSAYGGSGDAFIVKFDSLGQRQWGTYYGGADLDRANACSMGWNNDLFVVGLTNSSDNISTPGSYQPAIGGSHDAMLVKFNAAGQRQWGTYYGGVEGDDFEDCSYVKEDTLYLAGITYSVNNIASSHAWQKVIGGNRDDMLIKFIECWPIVAGPISGPDTLCKPSNVLSYSIPPLAHTLEYVWTVTPGIVIISGQGTDSITVDVNSFDGSGMISVNGLNKCDDPGVTAYLLITVSQSPVPVISGPDTTCAGTGKAYTTASGNSNYQWSISAGGVITSGGTSTDNTVTVTWNITGTQHIYVNYTDVNGCNATTPSDYIVQVTSSPSVDITISATSNNVCSGTQVTINSVSANGGGNPFYRWQVNGINAGTNSSSFSYIPLNNDLVRCILTSSITGCIMNNPDTSNVITMVVNPSLPVSISLSASQNPVCSGDSVIFTAIPFNGGTAPTYQWKVNGVNAGTNNSTYSFIPINGDCITCELTSNLSCTNGNPAISNMICMTVSTSLPVSVTISASANPVCIGTWVTLTATGINGGSLPHYQWKVNGVVAGTDTPTFTYLPFPGMCVICQFTSSYACSTGNPATSNEICVTVSNNLPVSVTISASANPVCQGNLVTFTASPTNGGAAPVYQWYNGLTPAGSNSDTYSYVPVNGDAITVVMTSNAGPCLTGSPATSNAVTLTVNPLLPASVTIAADANPVCTGTSVKFTATPVNGGTTPVYQWYKGLTPVGSNSDTYSYVPVNGDVITVMITSNASPCLTGSPATSNTIIMTVNPLLPASVTITASANPVCAGISVTFTATPVNGGTTPIYQWKVNGGNAGGNSPNYSYIPQTGDSIRCLMTSNLACVSNNPVSSNKIVMTASSVPVVTFTLCFDSITTVNAKPIKLKGGIPLGGTYSGPGVNSTTGVFTPSIAGIGIKMITYTYANSALCSDAGYLMLDVRAVPSFTCGNDLSDIRDGKVYPTIQIGSQCWMAANLNYGNEIPPSQHQRDNCIPEKYFNPGSSIQHPASVYQWDELMLYSETPGQQGLCPPAWHVPTETDWNTLFAIWTNNGFAGAPLKYSGYSGFNALMSGVRHLSVQWDYQDVATFFWSSTPYGAYKAWAHGINDYDPSVAAYPALRSNGFSIRCLKDN